MNGPGEMADADFGYVGSGPGRINLYVGKELVERNVAEAEADDRLVFGADLDGKWEQAISKLGFDLSMLSGDAGHA